MSCPAGTTGQGNKVSTETVTGLPAGFSRHNRKTGRLSWICQTVVPAAASVPPVVHQRSPSFSSSLTLTGPLLLTRTAAIRMLVRGASSTAVAPGASSKSFAIFTRYGLSSDSAP